jgi:tripartite-type tricarboxylate transporter receptor subunit TctC
VIAYAQAYPSRPVTVIFPFAAGSPAEPPIRLFAQFIEPIWKQSLILELRPGAGSQIGTQAVVKAQPDGYTLLYTGASLAQMKLLVKDLPFDPATALEPISYFLEFYTFLFTNAQTPANTIDEFVALAKANPGKFNYGSHGRGSSTSLAVEAFKRATGAPLTEIGYSGQGPYVAASLRNDVQLIPAAFGGAMKGQVDAGQLKPLLVYGARRSPQLPNVPAATDKGWNLPSFGWFGLYAPAGTPKAIIDKVSGDVHTFAQNPDMQKRVLDSAGALLIGSTPEQFRQTIDNDTRVWAEIANAIGLQPQ